MKKKYEEIEEQRSLVNKIQTMYKEATDSKAPYITKWKESYKDEENVTRERHVLQRIDFRTNDENEDDNGNDTTSIEKTTLAFDKFFHSNGQFMINVSKDEQAQIEIFDLVGRKVSNIYNVELKAGQNAINWHGESGVYIAKLSTKNEILTCKILIK